MEGSGPFYWTTPHSDFELYDARVAPLQSSILRGDYLVVVAQNELRNFF
jgi:hypothetical protein